MGYGADLFLGQLARVRRHDAQSLAYRLGHAGGVRLEFFQFGADLSGSPSILERMTNTALRDSEFSKYLAPQCRCRVLFSPTCWR